MFCGLVVVQRLLGLTHEQIRTLIRKGKLREFRDAGVENYKVEEVLDLAESIQAVAPQTTFEQLVEILPQYGTKEEKTIGPVDDDTLTLTEDPAIWQCQQEGMALRFVKFLAREHGLKIFVDWIKNPDEVAKAMGVERDDFEKLVKGLVIESVFGMELS